MDFVYRLVYNPFSFRIDHDRKRRAEPFYYGQYKPTHLKRLMIWIFNDRIDPVDWEEVPPFVEPEEESAHLQLPRNTAIHPYECLTQPNMLTMKDIYMRRLLLLGVFYYIYIFLERKKHVVGHFFLFNQFYYKSIIIKSFCLVWFYYIACKSFVHIDYQVPYN